MQIERMYYPVYTLGPGKRAVIWTVGCPHHCFHCSNPELWAENTNKEVSIPWILQLLMKIKDKIDGITIVGGEPFFQVDELVLLVEEIANTVTKDILIYTGYTLEELKKWSLKNKGRETVQRILNSISVLIDGRYIEELNDDLPLRGSSNQQIYFLDPSVQPLYEAFITGKRKVQNVFYEEKTGEWLSIGIPIREYRQKIDAKLEKKSVRTYKRMQKT